MKIVALFIASQTFVHSTFFENTNHFELTTARNCEIVDMYIVYLHLRNEWKRKYLLLYVIFKYFLTIQIIRNEKGNLDFFESGPHQLYLLTSQL